MRPASFRVTVALDTQPSNVERRVDFFPASRQDSACQVLDAGSRRGQWQVSDRDDRRRVIWGAVFRMREDRLQRFPRMMELVAVRLSKSEPCIGNL